MTKREQFEETTQWLDKIYVACESVIYETDVSLIGPFELINLINVRLFMEEQSSHTTEPTPTTKKTTGNKQNLVMLNPSNKKGKKDDTH